MGIFDIGKTGLAAACAGLLCLGACSPDPANPDVPAPKAASAAPSEDMPTRAEANAQFLEHEAFRTLRDHSPPSYEAMVSLAANEQGLDFADGDQGILGQLVMIDILASHLPYIDRIPTDALETYLSDSVKVMRRAREAVGPNACSGANAGGDTTADGPSINDPTNFYLFQMFAAAANEPKLEPISDIRVREMSVELRDAVLASEIFDIYAAELDQALDGYAAGPYRSCIINEAIYQTTLDMGEDTIRALAPHFAGSQAANVLKLIDYEEALEVWERLEAPSGVLGLYPDSPAHNEMREILRDRQSFDEFEQVYPDEAAAYLGLANLLWKAGLHEQVDEQFHKTWLRTLPDLATAPPHHLKAATQALSYLFTVGDITDENREAYFAASDTVWAALEAAKTKPIVRPEQADDCYCETLAEWLKANPEVLDLAYDENGSLADLERDLTAFLSKFLSALAAYDAPNADKLRASFFERL